MGIKDVLQVGTQIKKLRKAQGVSQKEFAAKVGIPYPTYSNYENNNRIPNMETLEKISRALNISVSELFGVSIKDTASFHNYLLSLGYEIYESPYNEKWTIHILESDSEIYLTDEEMKILEHSTKENVDLRISSYLHDGNHMQ